MPLVGDAIATGQGELQPAAEACSGDQRHGRDRKRGEGVEDLLPQFDEICASSGDWSFWNSVTSAPAIKLPDLPLLKTIRGLPNSPTLASNCESSARVARGSTCVDRPVRPIDFDRKHAVLWLARMPHHGLGCFFPLGNLSN